MKHVFLVLLFICGSANAQLTTRMGPEKLVGDERHFDGKATVDGSYLVDESGKVEFMTRKTREWLLFSNQEQAMSMLGLKKAVTRIDMKKTCAVQGNARIQIAGLVAPKVAYTPFKTTRLSKVVSKAQPQLVKCGKG